MGGSEDYVDSEGEEMQPIESNINYNKALQEFNKFYQYRAGLYCPKFCPVKSSVLSGIDEDGVERKIFFGPVVERGKDLPSGKNLADYICPKSFRMNVLMFFIDHKKHFPTMFKVCQCEASRRMVEVACERFLSLAGYVSSPRRTRRSWS